MHKANIVEAFQCYEQLLRGAHTSGHWQFSKIVAEARVEKG
jgi:hypothetical protein